MTEFTPVSSLLGGLLIGAASSLLLLANGRIAGISGIACGALNLRGGKRELVWRVLFIAGMVLAGAVLALLMPQAFEFALSRSWIAMAVAGLLVGIGTRLGSGCTSGHGVCGISRMSPRSLVATMTFMLAGVATVYLVRVLFGSSL